MQVLDLHELKENLKDVRGALLRMILERSAGDMERSALAHELGHIIAAYALGDGSEKKLKEFAAEYGVPY